MEPWPLPFKPIFANRFFRDYVAGRIPPKKVYDPKEVFAIEEHTPKELEMLKNTKKIDYNDLTWEQIIAVNRWAVRNGPCVYMSNSKRKSFGEMVTEYPNRRPYIIDGVLRQGEIANIIAASKQGKSWLADSVAVSIAMGRRLFDLYQCEQGKVLIIDNELHPEEIPWRLKEVANALAIPLDYLYNMIDIISLRGKLVDLPSLIHEIDDIQPGDYKLVILDAFYRLMPPRTDENDNGAMANLYNQLDHYATLLDAPICVIHHASKGNQSQKSVTDVGAGAGVQSRACDLHLVLRPHKEDGCVVLEAASRSSPPIDPIGLRFKFPPWYYDKSLDTRELKGGPDDNGSGGELNGPESRKLYITRHALMGTKETPALLTTTPEYWSDLWERIKGPPWNIDVGQTNFRDALGTLRGEKKIEACKKKGAKKECAWRLLTADETGTPPPEPIRNPGTPETDAPFDFDDNLPTEPEPE